MPLLAYNYCLSMLDNGLDKYGIFSIKDCANLNLIAKLS